MITKNDNIKMITEKNDKVKTPVWGSWHTTEASKNTASDFFGWTSLPLHIHNIEIILYTYTFTCNASRLKMFWNLQHCFIAVWKYLHFFIKGKASRDSPPMVFYQHIHLGHFSYPVYTWGGKYNLSFKQYINFSKLIWVEVFP